MNNIHGNDVNNIAKFNLLHDILNPNKCIRHGNNHYFYILHGCMNTCRGKTKYKNLILLYSVCSATIVMRRLTSTLKYI